MENINFKELIVNGVAIIPDGVKEIPNGAFGYCTNLISVMIPSSVTSIGEGAFTECKSLITITIPNSVTSIKYFAFYGCSSLKSIIIPKGVTKINNEAFKYCSSLKSIIIPKGVTYIGNSAFSHTGIKKLGSFKAFELNKNGKIFCRPGGNEKFYEVGEKSFVKGKMKLCQNGIHYCENLYDIFYYYNGEYGKDFVIGEISPFGEIIKSNENSKCCSRGITINKLLTREELINLLNNPDKD